MIKLLKKIGKWYFTQTSNIYVPSCTIPKLKQ